MIWHFYDVFITQGKCQAKKENPAILQWAIMGISKIRDFQEMPFVFLLHFIHSEDCVGGVVFLTLPLSVLLKEKVFF